MFKKAVIMLSIFVLAVSAVSAAENVSDDIAGTADSDVICIDENEDSLNCDESVLQPDVNNSSLLFFNFLVWINAT